MDVLVNSSLKKKKKTPTNKNLSINVNKMEDEKF